MSLISISQYRLLSLDNSSTDAQAQAYLDAASAAVETYLDRHLTYNTYSSWLHVGGDCLNVFLPEWPVRRIKMVGGALVLGTIRYTGVLSSMASVDITETSLTVRHFTTGVPAEFTFDFTTYPTIKLLTDAIQQDASWICYTSPTWDDYPSTMLMPGGGQSASGITLTGVAFAGSKYRLYDERRIELESSLGSLVYVNFDAGYATGTYPTQAGYAVTDPTVESLPADLMQIISNVGRDIWNISNTTGQGLISSESISKYSYTLNSGNTATTNIVSTIVAKYSLQLARYRKIGWAT